MYVYIIQSQKYFKIGITKNPKQRLKTFQKTLMPYDFNIIALKECQEEQCRVLEKEIHKKYNKYNYRGEWFVIDEKILNEIIILFSFKYIKQPNFSHKTEENIIESLNKDIERITIEKNILFEAKNKYIKQIFEQSGIIDSMVKSNLDVLKELDEKRDILFNIYQNYNVIRKVKS